MRRHFLKEIFNMTYEDLRREYIRLGTIGKVADHFGVSTRTIKNWFKEGDIIGLKHVTRERKSIKHDLIREWAHAHPEVRLPRSPKKIADITGISLATVKSYFTRRRRRLLRWLALFPNIGTLNVIMKSADGSYVPARAVDTYGFKVNPYSMMVTLYGRRKTGSLFRVDMTTKQLEALFNTPASSPATQHPSGQEHLRA
jgi:transposase